MSHASDLLSQAWRLARLDPRRPKQANLCRAVSSAYYAAFHLLIDDAARATVTGSGPHARKLRATLARCFEHKTMVVAARAFARPSIKGWVLAPPSAELIEVAEAFVELQEARHLADYDYRARTFTRSQVLAIVAQAERAFVAWRAVRKRPEARAFLLALHARPRA